MRNFYLGTIAAIAAIAAPLVGQISEGKPSVFEVVSVKPHLIPPGQFFFRSAGSGGLHATGDRYEARMTTLEWLIMDAYDLKDFQILELPRWAQGPNAAHFDITAKAAKPPTLAQLREMLQALLADRFQLTRHWDTKELPVYALVIAKGGVKMRKLPDDEAIPTFAMRPPTTEKSKGPFTGLVGLIASSVDRPLVDATGLAGNYECTTLNWIQFVREKTGAPPDDASGLSVFDAVQREFGLKLEPRKEQVKVLVIDRAEKPSEN